MKFFKLVENEITNTLIELFQDCKIHDFTHMNSFNLTQFDVYKKGEKVASTVSVLASTASTVKINTINYISPQKIYIQ